MKFFSRTNQSKPDRPKSPEDDPGPVSQAMVDFASETWRFRQTAERCFYSMDPEDGERFINQYQWYLRKIQAVLDESGLRIIDLTGQIYDIGMAVTPLNLEDFPERPDAVFRIAQMVEPIIIENGKVRKSGAVMLSEEMDEL